MTQEKLLPPLFVELKRRATAANLTTEGRRTLEPLLHEAREAWLQSDPAKVPLPIPSARQMGQWIEDLTVLDDAEASGRFRREMAERELLDLIARDDTRDEALKLLKAKIDTSPDAATSTTLRTIADFARPAMAAEVWKDRENIFVQYLIIGEPQFNEGTTNPTHFDRIDENLAHCVSGNSLTEGDYPVRIAIGYPDHPGKDRMFYLTNLPTARRRLLYEYQVKRDEAVRLREISERTVDHFLANKLVLDQTQVLVLAQLDPRISSKFAGKYLDTMPNARLLATAVELNEQATVHAGICYVMTRMGTREALPAVERVARSGRLGKPRFESPIQMAWIAALSICAARSLARGRSVAGGAIGRHDTAGDQHRSAAATGTDGRGRALGSSGRVDAAVRAGRGRGDHRPVPVHQLPLRVRQGPRGHPAVVEEGIERSGGQPNPVALAAVTAAAAAGRVRPASPGPARCAR